MSSAVFLSRLMLMLAVTFSPLMAVAAGEEDDIDALRDKLGNEWVLVKNDRRREIKTWIKQETGKRFRSFKVESTIHASMTDFVRAIMDVESYSRWYWEVREARLLRRLSPAAFYVYIHHRAPHGIPDRDVTNLIVITPQTTEQSTLTVEVRTITDLIPPKPPLVRMVAEDMIARVTAVGPRKIHYVAEGYVDPGGVVPAWASNSLQRIAPYQVVVGLKRMLESQEVRISDSPLPFPVREFGE